MRKEKTSNKKSQQSDRGSEKERKKKETKKESEENKNYWTYIYSYLIREKDIYRYIFYTYIYMRKA